MFSNRYSRCVLRTPGSLHSQICLLHVSPTIAVWQLEVLEILRIWIWVLDRHVAPFLAMLGWQSDVYLFTLLISMYSASGERGKHAQDKSYEYGVYRSKNLQHGASAGRPGAVGCLGRRRTGGRPWPGHGGHGPHSSHDLLMVKENCKLCSPVVGAVLRRCKALAMRRYFYGLSQLRRSGGPWFCCLLALRSDIMLSWTDPAFPQVIESDFSKNLAEITAAEESAALTFDRVSKENEIEKAKKEKDVEYKIKEAEGLDGTLTELSSDKEGVQSERDAIHSHLGKLEMQCVESRDCRIERSGFNSQ